MPFLSGLIVLIAILIFSSIKIVYEYERLVVFRLGRLQPPRGPGFVFVIPVIEKAQKIETWLITLDVPTQDVITKDNVSIKVNAVVYFWVVDVNKAGTAAQNFLYATSQLAQTTLRSVCGEAVLDELLTNRDQINHQIQEILDPQTDRWGVKVKSVQLKQIDLPAEMQRAMAKQAEAERERRAKVIAAEGEFQAAEKLSQAARIMSEQPQTLQLRYLQTLREIAVENNSTTIFPIPMEFLEAFRSMASKVSNG